MPHTPYCHSHSASVEVTRPGDNDMAAGSSSNMQQSLFAELQGCSNTEGFEPMRGNMII